MSVETWSKKFLTSREKFSSMIAIDEQKLLFAIFGCYLCLFFGLKKPVFPVWQFRLCVSELNLNWFYTQTKFQLPYQVLIQTCIRFRERVVKERPQVQFKRKDRIYNWTSRFIRNYLVQFLSSYSVSNNPAWAIK
jgi:hypothetical protein